MEFTGTRALALQMKLLRYRIDSEFIEFNHELYPEEAERLEARRFVKSDLDAVIDFLEEAALKEPQEG